ncbi:MAG: hypothetical protein J1F35_08795 [Erysipelotrichales bacterium]|nr:hypothetical protein [Erysipelotrichales bacterium]
MSTKIQSSQIQIPKHDNQYINEKYDRWLIKLFISPTNKIRLIYNKIWNNQEKYLNIVNYIFYRYIDAINPIEVLRRIQYNIEIRPTCKVCDNPVKFKGKPDSSGLYTQFCSPKCSTKFTNNWQYADQEKTKQTKLKRYGSIGYNNREKAQQTNIEKYGSKNHIEKIKRTKLEKYGNEYYRNPEKAKETLLNNYGVTSTFKSEEIQQKIKESNLEKYGVDNPFKSKEIRQKIFETNHKKYGYKSPLKNDKILDKIKETNLEKYGVENVFCSPEINDKIQETLIRKYGETSWSKTDEAKKYLSEHNKETWNNKPLEELLKIKNKIKQTCLEKYGSESWSASEVGRETLSAMIKSSEVQQKMYETKKKNRTFNTSKREQEILGLLKCNYSEVNYQYRDKNRYPFNCDYYIPSLDLFIEYQGKPDHGEHPYDPNNQEDINKLNKWIKNNEDLKCRTNREHTRYDKMIYGWTVSDPHKRKIAKQNNLNYLEIWLDWDDEKILEEIKKFES